MLVNSKDYICRKTTSSGRHDGDFFRAYRDWWLVKYNGSSASGCINLHNVTIPKRFVGKRIRFKIELVEE